MSGRSKPIRTVAVDAREGVCHVGCSLASPIVSLRITCASAPVARRLFDQLAKATIAGELTMTLPVPPAARKLS